MSRNKEHRLDTQSPTEKSYNPSEDFYSIPNTTTVSPVPIPAVTPVPRVGYEVPYNHNYPTGGPYPNPQTIYPNNSGIYPSHEIYPTSPHNLVLTNGAQFFPPQTDFHPSVTPVNQSPDAPKRGNWGDVVSEDIFSNYNF